MKDLVQKYQILVALVLIFFLWVAWQLRLVIGMLLAGYIIAAAVLPAVEFLAVRRLPRIIAVLVVYGSIGGVFISAGMLLAKPIREGMRGLAFSPTNGEGLLETLNFDPTLLIGALDANILGIAGSTLALASMTAVSLAMSVYFVYDWHGIRDWLSSIGNKQHLVLRIIDSQVKYLGAWVRGQLVLSVIVGAMVFVALTVIGLPFAAVLAIAAGVFELIPYAGPILAAIPAVLIALERGPESALMVGAIYIAIQQFENHALVPLVMKRAVKIHPIIIIVAILVGFSVMGIFGALLAVPLSALVLTTYSTIREQEKPEKTTD